MTTCPAQHPDGHPRQRQRARSSGAGLKDELAPGGHRPPGRIITGNQEQAGLATTEGIKAWRDKVIAAARSTGGKGGCPPRSLSGQLAETAPRARTLIADGFAVTLLAAPQGGLLLAQVQRGTRPPETAAGTILALAATR